MKEKDSKEDTPFEKNVSEKKVLCSQRHYKSKRNTLAAHLQKSAQDIVDGKYGQSGKPFITIRQYASQNNVAYVTAQRIFKELRKMQLLILDGNRHYITNGILSKDSELLIRITDSIDGKPTVGLYLKDISNPFFGEVAKNLESELTRFGYQLIIITGREKESAALDFFISIGAKGVISNPGFSPESAKLYKRYILPHVFLGRSHNNTEAVLVDNEEAGIFAARHLVKQGYNKFAYIGLEDFPRSQDERLRGFKAALNELGYNLNPEDILLINTDDHFSYTKCKNFLSKEQSSSRLGLFCFHDMIAAEMLALCKSLKLDVPSNVGIIGFDDLFLARITSPPLTTFAYNYSSIAAAAVNILLSKIKNPDISGNIISRISTFFLIRGSTAQKNSF